jgi:KEOPS complex subunit Pcc1
VARTLKWTKVLSDVPSAAIKSCLKKGQAMSERLRPGEKKMILANAKITMAFDSAKKANAIYNALKPEIHAGPSDRTKVKLYLGKNIMDLDIEALDSASLRASINTYSRWINMTKSLSEV